MVTRGLRNNNPGNIRKGQPWQGLAETQGDTAFCTFIDMEHGVRAMMIILNNYAKQGITTVEGIINRWAPSNENDTGAYIAAVSKALGVKSTDNLVHPSRGTAQKPVIGKPYTEDKLTMVNLVKAIIHHENGQMPLSNQVFDKAWEIAGL